MGIKKYNTSTNKWETYIDELTLNRVGNLRVNGVWKMFWAFENIADYSQIVNLRFVNLSQKFAAASTWANCWIFSVKPGEKYRIIAESSVGSTSQRFYIGVFPTYPEVGDTCTILSNNGYQSAIDTEVTIPDGYYYLYVPQSIAGTPDSDRNRQVKVIRIIE